MSTYSESIAAPRWLLGIVVLVALAMLGAAVAVLVADGSPIAFRAAMTVVLGAAALAMLFVVREFSALRVEVTEAGVEFGFRRFRRALRCDEIIGASVERYPWLRYGGWGVRFSGGGYRAYSQAFERGSVVIDAADQHRYHVSSRNAAELADAINHVARAESASP